MHETDGMEIGDPAWCRLIVSGAETLGIAVSNSHTRQLADYAAELLFWNRKTNLTAITRPAEVAVKHIVDSLAVCRYIPPGAPVLDVGAGAGFPGIPVKVLMPSLTMTLLDASRKKVSFLQHVIRLLKLADASAVQDRIEAFSSDPGRRQVFSVIICRAFTNLARFIELSLPLLSPSGILLAMKGRIDPEEINGASDVLLRTGRAFETRMDAYTLPASGAERHIYLLKTRAESGKGKSPCSPAA